MKTPNTTQQSPLEILEEATKKGCTFISFLYVTKDTGETARYTLNFGISNKAACEHDKLALEAYEPQNDLEAKAKAELLASLTQTLTNGVSDSYVHAAQNKNNGVDTYEIISDGIKLHKENGTIHLYGFREQKEQIAPPTNPKKPVNSRPLTLAKKHIKKVCGFKREKFREFIFTPEQMAGIKVKGDLIQLHD
jgi:hypothetical protein